MNFDNKIIHGDCLEVMKTFPDKSFDLVLTDPPYGLDEKLFQGGSKNTNWAMTKYKGEEWDKVPSKEIFDEIFRVSKNQIIFGGNYFDLPPTRGIICWDKQQAAPNFSQWEMAWTSFDKPAKMFRHTFMFDKHHPTMKPLEIFKEILKEYTEPRHTILDPFGGSCTTLIAAEELGRKCICIEKEEKYVAIGRERFASMTKQLF